jgi:hypothetical protein
MCKLNTLGRQQDQGSLDDGGVAGAVGVVASELKLDTGHSDVGGYQHRLLNAIIVIDDMQYKIERWAWADWPCVTPVTLEEGVWQMNE